MWKCPEFNNSLKAINIFQFNTLEIQDSQEIVQENIQQQVEYSCGTRKLVIEEVIKNN